MRSKIGILIAALAALVVSGPASALTYDFSTTTSGAGPHFVETGEMDETDGNIDAGTFAGGGCRDFSCFAGSASDGEWSQGNYDGAESLGSGEGGTDDPGFGDNATILMEFQVTEDDATNIVISGEARLNVISGGGGDNGYFYLWDYTDSEYLLLGGFNNDVDTPFSYDLSALLPGGDVINDYIETTADQLTVLFVNRDDSQAIFIDFIQADVTPAVIPEPTTALLLGMGLVALAAGRKIKA